MAKRNKVQVREDKTNRGLQLIANDQKYAAERYDTSWFQPTEAQKEAIYSFCTNDLTLLQGSSGTGKSTTAIAFALKELAANKYRQIVFIKTPSETSDDQIGFLPSSAEDKISVHVEAMRSIFHEFMSKAKLELEEKRGKIHFTIPNFIAGKTLNHSLVIIDESQMISPNILKLLIERCGEGSKYIVLGDKAQCYSAKKRPDGFSYLVDLLTKVDEVGNREAKDSIVGYVQMTAKDNVRSDLSKLIVEAFENQ